MPELFLWEDLGFLCLCGFLAAVLQLSGPPPQAKLAGGGAKRQLPLVPDLPGFPQPGRKCSLQWGWAAIRPRLPSVQDLPLPPLRTHLHSQRTC